MKVYIHNSLILPPPRIAQVIVGRISSLFFISQAEAGAVVRHYDRII